ncbi:MAG: restriction endonuclease subunit S [Muribaculaceae bacterium]|nr:restriction endonuclease subunit S [Muribaculaceae bacterium]
MSEWKEYRIGEICETQTGPFGSQLHNEDYVAVGTPIVTVEHLGCKNFTTQNLPFVSDEDSKRLSKYTLKEGDIVFSRVGSVDRCSYVSAPYNGWLFSGRCLRVRPKDNDVLDSQFLYYHFSNEKVKTFIRNIAVGATMPSINTKLLNEVPISLPSLSEQKKIAGILSSLDEKIETNRKINARLEELAQAIFKSWFIDFEPFGGKMPEDWKIVKMSEIIEDIAAGPFGSKLPKACFTSEGTPIIDGANLKERIVDETFSKFVSPSKSNELGRAVAHRNDFVVTISGTIGQIAYIWNFKIFRLSCISKTIQIFVKKRQG